MACGRGPCSDTTRKITRSGVELPYQWIKTTATDSSISDMDVMKDEEVLGKLAVNMKVSETEVGN
jgi:hypothetical protein